MHSAFGVDHGQISKRKRDAKSGAMTGAAIGAGTGAGAGFGASHFATAVGMDLGGAKKKHTKFRSGKLLKTTVRPGRMGPVTAATMGAGALGAGVLGAGAGAAIGRKKK